MSDRPQEEFEEKIVRVKRCPQDPPAHFTPKWDEVWQVVIYVQGSHTPLRFNEPYINAIGRPMEYGLNGYTEYDAIGRITYYPPHRIEQIQVVPVRAAV
ncbi:hypothetical protein D3C75_1092330 [compost metagenome]